jgi:hypothetical protein
MEELSGTPWVAIITAAGGVLTGMVGMLIKGRLDYEKLRQRTANDCRMEIEHERHLAGKKILALENEVEALTGVFGLMQSRHSDLPHCFMALDGKFIQFSQNFIRDHLEPMDVNPDDLIGGDGIGILAPQVIGPIRLLQSQAVVNGAAILDHFQWTGDGRSLKLFMEAMSDNQTLVLKIVE